MTILPLSARLVRYLEKRDLRKQFEKQKILFEHNPFHPSLETEILEPRHMRIYSFRITKKYRAIFIYREEGTVEMVDVNNHYR
jgi:plasmid maintenance system killer protein